MSELVPLLGRLIAHRMADVLDAQRVPLAIHLDAHHVDAPWTSPARMLHVRARHLAQLALLARHDRLQRGAVGVPPPGAHFYDDKPWGRRQPPHKVGAVLLRYNVDLAYRTAPIALDYVQSCLLQRLHGDRLAACPQAAASIGLFHAFREDEQVDLIGVEAGGHGIESGEHAARFADPAIGRPGVLHGSRSFVLQNEDGQILNTHSISAGLDYASVGPEHSYLRQMERAYYTIATDAEALQAVQALAQYEGIIPALESAHAVAEVIKLAPTMPKDAIILVNLSGRGDKDVDTVRAVRGADPAPTESGERRVTH